MSQALTPPTRQDLERELAFVEDLVDYWQERYDTARKWQDLSKGALYAFWDLQRKLNWRDRQGWKDLRTESKTLLRSHEKTVDEAERHLDYYTDWRLNLRAWLMNYNLIVRSWPMLLARFAI